MQNTQFKIEHNIGTKHTFERLVQEYTHNEKYLTTIQRHYLDSFDWRLLQNHYVCGLDYHLDGNVFFIEQHETGKTLFSFPSNVAPVFAHDIKNRHCCELLENILDVRALMTLVKINIKRRCLSILNKEQKTIARLQIESYSIPLETNTVTVPGRLIIVPVKGYNKLFNDIIKFVTENLKLSQQTTPLIDEVISKSGITAGQSVSKVKKKLADSLSTWEATKFLLCNLLKTMQNNEQGIIKAIDTEFLHDYRIAVRRTRSALSQIKHIFSEKELEYFKREFRWLGSVTSPTRDMDVYLLKFDAYMHELPINLRQDLIPLKQFLQNHWKKEHQRMCDALNSERYQILINKWQTTLNRDIVKSPQAYNAAKPAKQVAYKQIAKLYKKVLAEGKAIRKESPDEDLHELRKSCKKFRYLLEFFKDYFTKKQINHMVKILKQLQDNLGEFQDLCIQTAQLSHFAEQMRDENIDNTKTIMAMGVLVEKLYMRKEATRLEFAQRFKEFSQPEKVMEFKNAFRLVKQSEGTLA